MLYYILIKQCFAIKIAENSGLTVLGCESNFCLSSHFSNLVKAFKELFLCRQMGQFYYAAKAFDVLERLDPNPEYWEGKRGACVGIFQMIIAGHEPRYVKH